MKIVGLINANLTNLRDELLGLSELTFVPTTSLEDLSREIEDAEAILVSNAIYSADVARILHAAPRLRWIQATSIGVDGLLAHPLHPSVQLTNAARLKAPTVAEHAVLLLLALARKLDVTLDVQREGRWGNDAVATNLRSVAGMRVFCVGYGAIGQEVARKLRAFDAHVIAFNRSGEGEGQAHEVHRLDRLAEELPQADAIVLALPLANETRNLIGAPELALMKPTALLVNVGRGELISEPDLVDALMQHRIGGAGLDVFATEPLPEGHKLWRCPNTILTPHIGGRGGDGDRLLVQLIIENAARLRTGQPLINVVAHT